MVNPPRATTQSPKTDTSGGKCQFFHGTRISFIKLLLLWCPGGPGTNAPRKGLSQNEKNDLLV